MKKISFIGAGSVQFTTKVVMDIATYPALDNSEICLMDIDEYRLAEIEKCVNRIKNERKSNITVTTTTSREVALAGADAVVVTVFNGDVDIWRHEIEIPMKYGVDINVGDTRSVSGIFRALRNIPLMLDICRDRWQCSAKRCRHTQALTLQDFATACRVRHKCWRNGRESHIPRWNIPVPVSITWLFSPN